MRPLRLVAALLALTTAHVLCTRIFQKPSPEGVDAAPALPLAPERDAAAHANTRPSSTAASPSPAQAVPKAPLSEPLWAQRLSTLLSSTSWAEPGEVGVYVRHLGTGAEFSLRADESWYLASGIKVPVAVAVLQRTEQGLLTLDTPVRLEALDRVDGTGQTNRHDPGALLTVDYLLEQMLVYSDNTASDMLIRRVGLDEVNRLARQLSGRDFKITTLADVRRKMYSALHPRAANLEFADWVALRGLAETRRAASLSRRLGVELAEFSLASIDQAYAAYYASGYNSGPLSAYGALLAQVVAGKALSAEATAYLLGMMSRVQTGKRRLRATLPRGFEFAHKTGTQHRRVCDLGVARHATGSALDVVLTVCARGFPSVAGAERALREVGAAVSGSGVFESSPQQERRDDEPAHIAWMQDQVPAVAVGSAVDGPVSRDVRRATP